MDTKIKPGTPFRSAMLMTAAISVRQIEKGMLKCTA